MDHDTRSRSESRASHAGLVLFAIYVIFYAGFMAFAAYRPTMMSMITPFGSVNLAIMWGMGLILLALVLAFIYMLICRAPRQS
jgi:uncharacterized membrane protein (DUF485 family)